MDKFEGMQVQLQRLSAIPVGKRTVEEKLEICSRQIALDSWRGYPPLCLPGRSGPMPEIRFPGDTRCRKFGEPDESDWQLR